jgi:hypothetical protein
MITRDTTGKRSLRKRFALLAHKINANAKESRGKNRYKALKAKIDVAGRSALSMAKNSTARSRR